MQIISQIIILGILISFSILNGMKKDQKLFQPKSLNSLAAEALAKEIDPTQSLEKAFDTFKIAHKIPLAIAPLISNALLKRNQTPLRAILQAQIPLTLQINRFKQFPKNVYPLTESGLYVRSKKESYHNLPDPLYAGVAQLVPDPLTQSAPSKFFQIYSTPKGTNYFDDDDNQYRTPQNTRGMSIWNIETGTQVSTGSNIKDQICKIYPALAQSNKGFPDLMLYGLSSDHSVAWCRFVYLSDSDVYKEGMCAFKIDNNELLYHALDTRLRPLSHSGKFCVLQKNNSVEIAYSNTGSPKLALTQNALIAGISPQDDYAIVSRQDIVGTYIVNLKTKGLSNLTLNCQPFDLVNGICNPLNKDGSLIAVLENNQIYILKVLTNELVGTLPAPNSEDDDTNYHLLFSPDSTQILTLKVTFAVSNNYDDTYYQLTVFDIATQQPVEILDASQIANGDDKNDFIFCNAGDYLLFPNGQLRIQPQGLVNCLSLQELVGLLILEAQKKQQKPLHAAVIQRLQQNQFPKIQELIARRYGTALQ